MAATLSGPTPVAAAAAVLSVGLDVYTTVGTLRLTSRTTGRALTIGTNLTRRTCATAATAVLAVARGVNARTRAEHLRCRATEAAGAVQARLSRWTDVTTTVDIFQAE